MPSRLSIPHTARRAAGVALLALLASSRPSPGAAAPIPYRDPPRAEKVVLDERAGPFRRSFRVFVPDGVDGPMPLVVALHGGVASARIFEKQTGLTALAEREGFALVYPNGFGLWSLFRHWNGGFCCAKAARAGLDDRGFLDRTIEWVTTRHAIDRERIFVVGYSNGGFLAHWYAATRADRIAGLGIWASSIGSRKGDLRIPDWKMPHPTAPLPVFVAHGREDPRLPWDEPTEREGTESLLGAVGSAAFWARSNRCTAEPVREIELRGLEWRRWCDDGGAIPPVVLVGLAGVGHDWPDFQDDDPRADFDLAKEMWRFFATLGE